MTAIAKKGGTSIQQEDEKSFLLSKEQLKDTSGFGGKTIGFVGGFALLVSNLTGPGLVSLSLVYQDAGWLYPTIALVFMMVMSTFSGVFLCEAMATIPGNENLQGRVEFTTLAKFYFGRVGHLVSQIFINASLQATNIAGIVISSQVMDSMFVALFKRSCGLQLHPHFFHWVCVNGKTDDESPFGNAIMLFTIGYLVVMAIIIPLGYLNLDDNIIIQIAALTFLVAVISDWIVTFSLTGLSNDVPSFTSIRKQAGVLGTIMFNFSYITTIPSWVNEKKPSVSVHRSLWSACIVSTTTFFLVGFLGARAFGNMSSDSDILSVINDSHYADEFSHILVYLFPLMVLATSIPVYSIIVRYNLLQNKLCSKFWANIFAVVIPWAVAIPFMSGGALNALMNWSSLICASSANFIIPFIIKACEFRLNVRERLSEEQLEIIRSMHPALEDEKEKKKEPVSVEDGSHPVTGTSSFRHRPRSRSWVPQVEEEEEEGEKGHHHHHHHDNTNHHVVDDIPTPLPPGFQALPHSSPESSLWVAKLSVAIMAVIVIAVIVLAIVFNSSS